MASVIRPTDTAPPCPRCGVRAPKGASRSDDYGYPSEAWLEHEDGAVCGVSFGELRAWWEAWSPPVID